MYRWKYPKSQVCPEVLSVSHSRSAELSPTMAVAQLCLINPQGISFEYNLRDSYRPTRLMLKLWMYRQLEARYLIELLIESRMDLQWRSVDRLARTI